MTWFNLLWLLKSTGLFLHFQVVEIQRSMSDWSQHDCNNMVCCIWRLRHDLIILQALLCIPQPRLRGIFALYISHQKRLGILLDFSIFPSWFQLIKKLIQLPLFSKKANHIPHVGLTLAFEACISPLLIFFFIPIRKNWTVLTLGWNIYIYIFSFVSE